MEGIIHQWRRKEDVAQEYGNAHAYRGPVVETLSVDPLEKVQYHHYQTRDIEKVEHQFVPGIAKSEMDDTIEHDSY